MMFRLHAASWVLIWLHGKPEQGNQFSSKGFPRKGQILPAPGRNVTTGDKERNRCRASDKKGNEWHRISDDERSFY